MAQVYIAKAGGLYKIGCSENPTERIKKLQAGCPLPITLVHAIETTRPRETEAELQRRYAPKKEHGEWYRLTEADIAHLKGETIAKPAAVPVASQRPAGALTGALAALHDLWDYRWYLLVVCVLAVPAALVWNLSRDLSEEMPTYQFEAAAPTVQFVSPTILPPVVVPVVGPAAPPLPAVVVDAPSPIAELIPINNETAAALAQPDPQPPEPTAFVWPVTWPAPTANPLTVFAENARTTLTEAGYEFLPGPWPTPAQNFVGH